eukprot:TRINITY_DN5812_c0_g1_i2.p2 TRINITY_DN5812_c0_g1~~TRINITY_DN5812_c0_g1_i2.p2  ORF type:complete len:198 (-),score=54.28 TRINITY_DN5812_c0_g1_i2:10-603(-)
MSASVDGTVRSWDIRQRACTSRLHVKGRPSVAFDPNGLVFAVASAFNMVRLFDVRKVTEGPFATFRGEGSPSLDVMSVSFSPTGKHLLCATNENYLFLLDAFSGAQLQAQTEHANAAGALLEPGFSADGEFFAGGSEDGTVYIWHTATGRRVAALGGHVGPVGAVRFSPTAALLASSCYNLVFWTFPPPPAEAPPGA